jgi:hypothetical protein
MLILFWSLLGFPLTRALLPNGVFTAKFFLDNSVPNLAVSTLCCDRHRRLVLNVDKTFPHRAVLYAQKMEESRVGANPHPVFSSDLAPSAFFLFGGLNNQPAG